MVYLCWLVRDLGGHLDVTHRVRAGTLARRAVLATAQVHLVGALPFGFLRLVGFVKAKYLPASLHGAEGAHISCKNFEFLPDCYWPRKLPMANPHAVLSLLDAPDCCDPELYVIWGRFRQMPEFTTLMNCDRSAWPWCLAWRGWLPTLPPRGVHPPWAAAVVDSVDAALESSRCLPCSSCWGLETRVGPGGYC